MIDFYVNLGLSIVFSVLAQVVKNPEKKEELKRALVKLRDQLLFIYPVEEFPGKPPA
jgi:hypothetical protein